MQYREIKADTIEDARSKIRREFGDRARIIRTTEVNEGGFFGIGRKKYIKMLISISEDDFLKRYKENLGIQSSSQNGNGNSEVQANSVKKENTEPSADMKLLMEKLANIENRLERVPSNGGGKQEELPQNLIEVKEILKENEFYDDFINKLLLNMQENMSISKIDDRYAVHNYAYNYIKDKLDHLIEPKREEDSRKIIVLVGPTGVGKTTTIAKIAANAIREHKSVELISIDGYRIGARYQLEKYAELMNAKMNAVEDNLQLKKIVTLSDADLILVDTIGRGQHDEMHLVKMKKILELQNKNTEFILTLSATTKPREIERIFKNFDIFDYKNIIITKNDESETIGSIINTMINKEKGILYYTIGQKVPNDIEKATVFNMMSKIKGFDTSLYLNSARY